MTKQIQHLIGGESIGEAVFERRNPAVSDQVVALSPRGDAADVDRAVSAAAAAAEEWAATPAPARGAILADAAQLLAERADGVAEDLVREEGKTLAEASGEVQRAVGVLRYFAGEGHRMPGETLPASSVRTLIYTRREPLGVGAVITPWNFPIAIPAWKIAPALIAGNAVVHKPAELTPLSADHLARALHDAGLPAGVLNVVHGSGSEIGDAIVSDPRVAGVSFTGSTTVGKAIHEKVSARMGRVQLEMGGKNPIIVADDADLEAAAQIVARSAFGLTGQACTATSRVIASEAMAERLAEALAEQARGTFRPGNGLEGAQMGPVVSPAQVTSIGEQVQEALDAGADLVVGGGAEEGQLFEPTVLRGVTAEDPIAQTEVFGPVLAMLEASDFEHALELANGVPYGLAAGICTSDLSKAHLFAEQAEAGVVKVNQPTVGLELQVPFGGIKDSSTATFREQGSVATDFWSWSKSVYMSY